MIEMDTRLRVARGIAPMETEAHREVFETLKQRGHPDAPPPTVSDGWGGVDEAMVQVYGQVPPYSGRGRPPTHKQPQVGWHYLQVVKQRDAHGRLLGIRLQVKYGEPRAVLARFGRSTAYVERTHLTMRHLNSRLTRKTLAFSKSLEMHRAAAAWEDAVYNWARPLKTLRRRVRRQPGRRWQARTPAMAARLTDHVWTVRELLTMVVLPNT